MLEPERNVEITPFSLVWRRNWILRGVKSFPQGHLPQSCVLAFPILGAPSAAGMIACLPLQSCFLTGPLPYCRSGHAEWV